MCVCVKGVVHIGKVVVAVYIYRCGANFVHVSYQ